MKLTLDACAGTLLELDLGTADGNRHGYLDGDDLGATGNNLYLYIDGQEYGSLFFHTVDGKPTITLGQFDFDVQQWEERNPLTAPVLDPDDPKEA